MTAIIEIEVAPETHISQVNLSRTVTTVENLGTLLLNVGVRRVKHPTKQQLLKIHLLINNIVLLTEDITTVDVAMEDVTVEDATEAMHPIVDAVDVLAVVVDIANTDRY